MNTDFNAQVEKIIGGRASRKAMSGQYMRNPKTGKIVNAARHRAGVKLWKTNKKVRAALMEGQRMLGTEKKHSHKKHSRSRR